MFNDGANTKTQHSKKPSVSGYAALGLASGSSTQRDPLISHINLTNL